MPWLNRMDAKWLEETIKPYELALVLEDHHPAGALYDHMIEFLAESRSNLLAKRRMIRFSVEGWPACGTPQEALRHHRLDGASLAERILLESD